MWGLYNNNTNTRNYQKLIGGIIMFFSKVGKSSVKITSNGVEAKMQAKSEHSN